MSALSPCTLTWVHQHTYNKQVLEKVEGSFVTIGLETVWKVPQDCLCTDSQPIFKAAVYASGSGSAGRCVAGILYTQSFGASASATVAEQEGKGRSRLTGHVTRWHL